MLMNMKDLLAVANKHYFAVPAFNTSSNMILTGVIEAAEELNAPVIIEIHPDELHFTKPSFVKAVIEEAHNAKVPVCIHLDHGADFANIIEGIRYGFTSVMIDASHYSREENVALTRKVVEAAHAVDVSVEAELGTIGSTEFDSSSRKKIIYTDPDDAVKFVEETGVDSLAIAIGTAHGIYPKDMKPELKLDLLTQIKAKVKVPLVLHGGSANPDAEIAEAVKRGINKINISSDIKEAFYQKCREVLKDENLREPNAIYPPCINAMKEVVRYKTKLFNDDGKASLYI